ncbi:MAG: hypothetical protein WCT31_03420 [Candidatus Micrarchaeia archaeon]|jgi:hypothetical protein
MTRKCILHSSVAIKKKPAGNTLFADSFRIHRNTELAQKIRQYALAKSKALENIASFDSAERAAAKKFFGAHGICITNDRKLRDRLLDVLIGDFPRAVTEDIAIFYPSFTEDIFNLSPHEVDSQKIVGYALRFLDCWEDTLEGVSILRQLLNNGHDISAAIKRLERTAFAQLSPPRTIKLQDADKPHAPIRRYNITSESLEFLWLNCVLGDHVHYRNDVGVAALRSVMNLVSQDGETGKFALSQIGDTTIFEGFGAIHRLLLLAESSSDINLGPLIPVLSSALTVVRHNHEVRIGAFVSLCPEEPAIPPREIELLERLIATIRKNSRQL